MHCFIAVGIVCNAVAENKSYSIFSAVSVCAFDAVVHKLQFMIAIRFNLSILNALRFAIEVQKEIVLKAFGQLNFIDSFVDVLSAQTADE